MKTWIICLVLLVTASVSAQLQSLDGSPYSPDVDPNIDMNIGNWKDSEPRYTHGTLEERDILTKGDPLNPSYI